jgi:hypothetical protein
MYTTTQRYQQKYNCHRRNIIITINYNITLCKHCHNIQEKARKHVPTRFNPSATSPDAMYFPLPSNATDVTAFV